MSMAALDPKVKRSRALELQLWREANTIFMGPSGGHGGCGALGLALSAHRRGFKAEVHLNHKGVLLAYRAKSKERVAVMRVLQDKDLAEAKAAGIPVTHDGITLDEIEAKLRAGFMPIVLNSMRYLHQDADRPLVRGHRYRRRERLCERSLGIEKAPQDCWRYVWRADSAPRLRAHHCVRSKEGKGRRPRLPLGLIFVR